MKKVLMITYDFPPARTSGIYRPVKFVKHLAKLGWDPVILTVKNPYVQASDDSLLKDIPEGTKIYRSRTLDLMKVNDDIHKLLFGSDSHTRQSGNRNEVKAVPSGKSVRSNPIKKYFLSPLNRFVVNWFYLPDSKAPWYLTTVCKALRIARKEEVDVVYTTSFPPTVQLIGLTMKSILNKPWVADFRDNWVVGFGHLYGSKTRMKFDRWLMGRIVKRADQVITMCRGNARDIMTAYGYDNDDKFTAITNGYDDDDFPDPRTDSGGTDSGKMIMLHMGTLYRDTPGLFFEALAEVFNENPEMKKNIEVHFIGYIFAQYTNLISKLGLNSNVRILEFMPHPQAIEAMRAADVLLLFMGGHKILNQQFPGKFFEYLKCGKTILGIGQRGEIAEVLLNSGSGVLAEHDDKDRIKQVIIELYGNRKENRLSLDQDLEIVTKYEYKNIAKCFADVLGKAAESSRRAEE